LKIFDKKYLGLIIGAIFIYLIVKNIDINKSIEEIRHLNPYFLLLMIPVYLSSFAFRALRWRTILSEPKIKLSSFLNFLFRGWLVNCIVPARGGEIYRTYYFGKRENISKVKTFASIVLERIFDGLVLFSILFILTSFVYANKKFLGVSIVAGIVFCGVFAVLLLLAKFYNNTFFRNKCSCLILKIKEKNIIKRFFNEKICEILSKIFNKLTQGIISFMEGLEIFKCPIMLLKTLFLSIMIWICEGAAILLLIKAFGYSIGVLGSLLVLSIIAFASLIPGGPAALGPFQWGYIVALRFFNISQEAAFAISIINQLFIVLIVASGSLFYILSDMLNKEKIIQAKNL
jgi:uncharacterized protein (TIRG00374 family)